jgi:cellulose synthase/poly-beta-1,6-N-acetylglucosamine synthase-like glycosyltransferase
VSLHVPAHNEPPDMVIETLQLAAAHRLSALRGGRDRRQHRATSAVAPVEAWCAGHGVKFVHLDDWPGYKSGALNYALRERIDPRAEIIGVVDSDYQIDPGSCVAACRSSPTRTWASSRPAGLPRLEGGLLPAAALLL